jgi:hypothetical protein
LIAWSYHRGFCFLHDRINVSGIEGRYVWWGLFNALVAYLLFRAGKVSPDDILSLIVFIVGAGGMSLMLAKNFVTRIKYEIRAGRRH